jgi:uncharacterized protein (DUF736 family)
MSEERRDNSGIVFRETERRSERSPDFRGKAMVGGVAYRVAGWRKRARNGEEFLSLAFSLDEERTPF